MRQDVRGLLFRAFALAREQGGPPVTIDIDPVVRAFVCGLPVRLRQLRVSVETPDELIAALRT